MTGGLRASVSSEREPSDQVRETLAAHLQPPLHLPHGLCRHQTRARPPGRSRSRAQDRVGTGRGRTLGRALVSRERFCIVGFVWFAPSFDRSFSDARSNDRACATAAAQGMRHSAIDNGGFTRAGGHQRVLYVARARSRQILMAPDVKSGGLGCPEFRCKVRLHLSDSKT